VGEHLLATMIVEEPRCLLEIDGWVCGHGAALHVGEGMVARGRTAPLSPA
jgi:hypothetical protein